MQGYYKKHTSNCIPDSFMIARGMIHLFDKPDDLLHDTTLKTTPLL